MAKKKTAIEKGSAVHLVTAAGRHVAAVVTSVRKGGLVDLECEELGTAGKPLVITSSPCDELGKKPDSWHVPEDLVAETSGDVDETPEDPAK